MIGRLAHAFARLELILSNVTLAMLVLVLILQVVFRYGLQTGLTWSEEVSRFAFIWFVYLSASLAAQRGAHIRVTLFVDMLIGQALCPASGRYDLDRLQYLCCGGGGAADPAHIEISGVFHRPVPADGLDLHHHSGSACADDLTHPGAAVELLAPRGSDHRGGTGVG